MILFSVVFLIPLIFAIGWFIYSKEICWKELAIMALMLLIVAGISAGICYHSNTSDTEVWNGIITSKKKEWTSCEHSYQCNCIETCTGYGKNQSCSTTCQTCYDHSNDWDWAAYTSNDERIEISRIDRRGSSMPPRWQEIKVGEPSSIEHNYTNYIKASPDSLFRRQGLKEKFNNKFPKYPKVYDYYKLNRLLTVNGASVSDYSDWNNKLNIVSGNIGKSKQVNILVVIAKDLQHEYFYALEESWIGGKKNDIVLVIGTKDNQTIEWVDVMAWTTNSLFKTKLRDSVLQSNKIDSKIISNTLLVMISKYHTRKPMSDFEYLKSSITPSITQWVITLVISVLLSTIFSYLFHTQRLDISKKLYYRTFSSFHRRLL